MFLQSYLRHGIPMRVMTMFLYAVLHLIWFPVAGKVQVSEKLSSLADFHFFAAGSFRVEETRNVLHTLRRDYLGDCKCVLWTFLSRSWLTAKSRGMSKDNRKTLIL